MRKKAQDKGALKTTEQQKVETKVVEKTTVIVVESADPEIIYVPVYSPTVVYPPPVYPYPPIYYPPLLRRRRVRHVRTAGVMSRAAVWGGAWGHCGWGAGHNDININVNNNFNRNTNINGTSTAATRGQRQQLAHNSQHRGGAPYSSKATASKYGGVDEGRRERDAAGPRVAARAQPAGPRQLRRGERQPAGAKRLDRWREQAVDAERRERPVFRRRQPFCGQQLLRKPWFERRPLDRQQLLRSSGSRSSASPSSSSYGGSAAASAAEAPAGTAGAAPRPAARAGLQLRRPQRRRRRKEAVR